jgi:hypothetical protein
MTEQERDHIGRFATVDRTARFWAKVNQGDGCWEWQGKRIGGYGILLTGPAGAQRRERAHRVSWEINRGPIPSGAFVLHSCDNPPCVNPDHLHLGTNADNMAEMRERGRSFHGPALQARMRERAARGERHGWKTHPDAIPRGEGCGASKLTRAIVRELRRRYAEGGVSQRQLAAEFGITQGTLWSLLRGLTWRES